MKERKKKKKKKKRTLIKNMKMKKNKLNKHQISHRKRQTNGIFFNYIRKNMIFLAARGVLNHVPLDY